MTNLCRLAAMVLVLAVAACGAREAARPASGQAEPPPSGTIYAVGSSTRFIHDPDRPFDAVAGVNEGIRTLIAEIWYPVEPGAIAGGRYRRATYGDYVFGDLDMHRRMMTKTTFFQLTPQSAADGVSQQQIDAAIEELFSRERGSYVDAPPAESATPFPVVVMSHGDAGSRYNMETACEYLAAHGYVVIAPEHTGNSPYAMTGRDPALKEEGGDAAFRRAMAPILPLLDEHGAYGKESSYGQSFTPLADDREPAVYLKMLDASLLQRLGDLRATLGELDRMNTGGAFAGRLALDRIGLMGRSFGGATTLVGIGMEPRFTAGFAVVSPGWSDQRGQLPAEMLAPEGEESVLLGAKGINPLSEIGKPVFLLSGGEDDLVIGLTEKLASTGAAPMPTPDNPHPILRQAYEKAGDIAIWAVLGDSNHGSCAVSGSYWWPKLKPDQQQRHFQPTVSFRLIDPARAHAIQKDKALAFFDLTIRGQAAARERLLDRRYATEGLALEWRNL